MATSALCVPFHVYGLHVPLLSLQCVPSWFHLALLIGHNAALVC